MSDLAERIAGLSEEKRQLLELLRREKREELARERTRAAGERSPGEESVSRPFGLVSEDDRRMMPDDVVDAYPLTMLQSGMIYHMEETPDYPLYHNVDSYNLEGRLEHETLVEAINRVIARHPVLRTSFALTAYREPLQLVHEHAHLPVGLDDLRHLPVEEQDRIVNEYVEAEKRRRFDISRPPLLRFHVHRRTDETYQLTLTEFHPILDGWSLNSTLAEIFNLYFALLNEQTLPDERPLAGTFRDYVMLERKALESEESKEYWTRRLGDASMLELPRWPEAYRDRGGRPIVGLRFPITQALLEQLKRYAQSISVPLKSVLLAAHMKVLGALGGRGDVVTGLSTQGRPETADGDQIRGLFLNILPYRLSMPDGSWTDLIREAFRAERDLMPYRRYPIAAMQKSLGVRRFFEVAFNVVQFHIYMDLLESGNKLEMVGTGQEFEENNFTLMTNFGLHPSGSHLILVLEYHTSDMCEEQVRAIAGYYLNTLEAIAANPDALHQNFSVLSNAERGRILREWNDTGTANGASAPRLLPALFEAQAAETPDAVALVFEGESLRYRELNERANRFAHQLRALGVGAESIVAIMTNRSVEMVVSLLATLKAGAAYLPLDPAYPPQRLAFMLADAAPKVFLTQRLLRDLLAVPEGVGVILVDEPSEAEGAQHTHNPEVEVDANNLAYIIYTSGSTGTPKGVMVTHGGLSNYLNWSSRAYRLSEGCGAPVHSPLGFDLTVTALWNPLITGGRVDLLREGEGIERLSEALLSGADYGVVKITPAHLEALRHVVGERSGEERLRTRCFVIGGEALNWEDVRYWREHHHGVRLINEYGPTETVVGCCVHEVGAADNEEGAGVPIGRPIGNMEMYVLDEQMHPVPLGVAGELFIGGVALGRGYLNRPSLTAERFVPHPYSTEPGVRLYRTGDVGRHLPDGRIEYLGRRDEQVKIRGFRIELGEIEAALRAHESVREAVVAVRSEEGGHKRLVAYLVASAAGRELKGAELRAYLEARLPEYMIPGKFVEVEQIPLTANGKMNRRALAEFEDAAGTEQRKQSYAAPRTPTEELLAKIWAEALGAERVGVHDNFFEMGGDSILILPIIAKAAKSGLKIIPRNIFQHPTIAELADFANNAKPRAHKREPRRVRHAADAPATFPLTPIQHAFFESNAEAPHHFNQSVLLSVPRELTHDILHTATGQLMRRHDALRLRFKHNESDWYSLVSDASAPSPLTVIDLKGLPAGSHPRLIESAADAAQASLDLTEGPLLRVLLFETGQETSRLLIAIHHLAVDGVSWRILLEDLQTVYRDLRAGRPAELPPETTSFARWAAQLSAHVTAGALSEETDYWLRQTAAAAAALPVTETGSAPLLSSAKSLSLTLTEEETRSLLQEVPRAYNTQINDVLLAALALAVSGATGVRRVRLDLEGHGREELVEGADLSRTVGWFTSVYPVLLDVSGAGDEAAALKAVKEQLRAVPNRGVGYGLLKYLSPDAETRERLRQAPPSQISFNYLGQFDRVLSGEGFGAAPESGGRSQSPLTKLTHALDISGHVSGGELRLDWSYSPGQLDEEFVKGLMEAYGAALRKLIAHCAGRGRRGHTPSDFPLARVGQEELERLAESGAEIEDIYAMSPLQEGLLFHTLQTPHNGVYMQQMSCRFGEGFRVETFKRSWAAAVERHAILRSGYAWEGLEEPLAVVRRVAELEIVEEDWRGRSEEERERRPEEYMREDRARGFDVARGPLMRLWLMRETDELYRFVWSMHHLILDGWSMGLLIKEVFENYEALARGEELERRAERPYREYIGWLKRQDGSAAETFWRAWLKGFKAPTPLAVEPPAAASDDEEYAHQVAQYSGAATEELRAFARRQRLTLNTLIQGAWALLLSRHSGERDVVFGIVVSGRPTELAGFESMIGLFVNTLPMRARISDEESVTEWLRGLQESQAEMQQFEHSPLVQVQGWSEVPRNLPLFDSYLNFLNYPVDESLRKSEGPVEIHNASSIGAGSYPLAIDVTPGSSLSVEITYDARRFGRAAVARLLSDLETLLQGIVTRPDADLRTLGEMLDESDRQARAARDEEQQESLRLKMRTARRRAVVKG